MRGLLDRGAGPQPPLCKSGLASALPGRRRHTSPLCSLQSTLGCKPESNPLVHFPKCDSWPEAAVSLHFLGDSSILRKLLIVKVPFSIPPLDWILMASQLARYHALVWNTDGSFAQE